MIKARAVSVLIITFLPLNASALPGDLKNLRQQSKQLLTQKSCVDCHTPGLPTSQPRALRIYDLSSESWISTIQDNQLNGLITRAKQGVVTFIGIRRQDTIDARALPFSEKEIELLSKTVKLEKDYRKANPAGHLNEAYSLPARINRNH